MLSNRASSGWTVDRVLSSAKIDANSRVEAVNLVVYIFIFLFFFFSQSKLELCTRGAMCFACILFESRIHPSKSRRSWKIDVSTNISRGCLSKAIPQVLLGIAHPFDINTHIRTYLHTVASDRGTQPPLRESRDNEKITNEIGPGHGKEE